jgi:hypothetical protein
MASLSISCESSRVLLIPGGVGITPMRVLFETLPINPGQNVMLLYRAHDRGGAIGGLGRCGGLHAAQVRPSRGPAPDGSRRAENRGPPATFC